MYMRLCQDIRTEGERCERKVSVALRLQRFWRFLSRAGATLVIDSGCLQAKEQTSVAEPLPVFFPAGLQVIAIRHRKGGRMLLNNLLGTSTKAT